MNGLPRISSGALAIETYRGLRGHWMLTVVVGVVSVVCGFALMFGLTAAFASLSAAWRSQVARGANVFVVTSTAPHSVPSEGCDALRNVVGVRTAGAVMDSRTATFVTSPASQVVISDVTPGYVAIAFPDSRVPVGVTTGPTAAAEIGAVSGATVLEEGLRTAPIVVGQVSDLRTERIAGSRNAILVPVAPAGLTNACYVEAYPNSREAIEKMLPAWFPPGHEWVVTPLVSPADFEINVVESTRHSPLVFAGPILAALALLISALTVWIRRQEFALYQLLGFSNTSLLKMLSLEWLATVVTPAMSGLTLAAAAFPPGDIEPMFVPVGAGILFSFFAALLAGPPLAFSVLKSAKLADLLKGA